MADGFLLFFLFAFCVTPLTLASKRLHRTYRKVKNYLKLNHRSIFGTILLSAAFSFLFFPWLISIGFVRDLIGSGSTKTYFGLTALLWLFLALTWKRAQTLLRRYKNTWRLEVPPFYYPDYLFWFLSTCFILIFFFHVGNLPNTSHNFKRFLGVGFASIISWLLALYIKQEKKPDDQFQEADASLSDEPIQSSQQDLLGRQKFVDDFYNQITNLPFSDSFVFGLYGSWGEGKTSAINLLNNKFADAEDFLIMNFDPWSFHDEQSIISAFYTQLEGVLSEMFILPAFKNDLAKYRRLVSPLIESGLNLDFFLQEEGLPEIKERIESYLLGAGKKIVIIIDDIDRLHASEILLVFKIVRLNAKFKNTIFVLSFDYEATRDKLNDVTQQKGDQYIEKIVQKPVVLPKIEQSQIDRFLFLSDHAIPEYDVTDLIRMPENMERVTTSGMIREIGKTSLKIGSQEGAEDTICVEVQGKTDLLDQLNLKAGEKVFIDGSLIAKKIVVKLKGKEIVRFRLSYFDKIFRELLRKGKIETQDVKDFDEEIHHFYRSSLSKLFQDMRDAKRYINSLYFSLPAIAEEVDIRDFCLLEFIKVFQLELYNDIFENWWFYINLRSKGEYFSNPFSITLSNDRQKIAQIRKEHIENIVKRLVNDSQREELMMEILKRLFPDVLGGFIRTRPRTRTSKESRRIGTASFAKYFSLKVPYAEVSYNYIETVLKTLEYSNDPMADIEKTFFNLQQQEKLGDFLEKLRWIFLTQVSPEMAQVLITAISRSIHKFLKLYRGIQYFYESEFDKAKFLLRDLINERVEISDIHKIVEEVLLNTEDLILAVELVDWCHPDRERRLKNICDSIRAEEAQCKLSDRFKKHFIEERRDIFEEFEDENDWGLILGRWASNWLTFQGDNGVVVSSYVESLVRDDARKLVRFLARQRHQTFEEGLGWNIEQFARAYDLEKFKELAESSSHQESITDEERMILSSFLEAVNNFDQTSAHQSDEEQEDPSDT
ncbi:MAG: P-loop NTPase fold protein [Acidobacteriota bacterium]